MFFNVNFKFQGMRKASKFVVYPGERRTELGHRAWLLQSNNRIVEVIENCEAIVSKNTGSAHPHSVYLSMALGAKRVTVPSELIEQLKQVNYSYVNGTNSMIRIT